ncbi:MAG: hypothetical protein M2R45_00841 [Verrucomicrobia subdivision 3 bacterium]|nr:hypothetical protein [Limisphaerales bacterium]MCS1413053.1 hypothetical protein [Limisphaerales bacterium]
MSHIDHQLECLLKAASRVPEPTEALPAGLEQRVLARLRMQKSQGEDVVIHRMLSWAMVYSCLLALLCFVWSYMGDAGQHSEAATVVNSSIQLSLAP